MDKLCVGMVGEGGVGVGQQKYFRVSVPQAFPASDLCQWLLATLSLDDIGGTFLWRDRAGGKGESF